MPQLDFSMYASQGLWMIAFFCLLWAMLAVFITPKIAEIQEKRRRKFYEYMRKTEQLRRKARSAASKYDNSLKEANKKAVEEMEAEQAKVQNYMKEAETQTSAKLNQQIASSEFLLAKERQETMSKIEEIAEDLAVEIIKKLGLKRISKQDISNISKKESF